VTTADLQGAIENFRTENDGPSGPYDLVTLLIGVNNQFQGLDFSRYEPEFTRLLGEAIAFADGDTNRVFVLSIPDYGVTPFGQSYGAERISREIDAYNVVNRQVAERYGVSYFDPASGRRPPAGLARHTQIKGSVGSSARHPRADGVRVEPLHPVDD
jgi:hypothetical protein